MRSVCGVVVGQLTLTGDNAGDNGGDVDCDVGSGLERADEPVSPLSSAPEVFTVRRA